MMLYLVPRMILGLIEVDEFMATHAPRPDVSDGHLLTTRTQP